MKLKELRFGDKVLYNNTIWVVYGLCGPMPNKDPYYNNKATVTLWCNGLITVTLDDVESYKEETMEIPEKLMPKIDFNEYCKDKYLLDLGDYEIKEEDGKTYAVRKRFEYPKTYEECCKVVNASPYVELVYNVSDGQKYSYDIDNLQIYENIRRLKICRDAYWKIAGEQMGLGKSWKPDYIEGVANTYYTIYVFNNKLFRAGTSHRGVILAFPTEKIRDAFYENFKDLIEQCKELL